MIEINGEIFLNRIDKILNRQNKTRKELSNDVNIKLSTISNWKSSNCMPSIEVIIRIAESLDVSLNYLLTGNDYFNFKNQNNQELNFLYNKYFPQLNLLDNLSEKNKTIIYDLLIQLQS